MPRETIQWRQSDEEHAFRRRLIRYALGALTLVVAPVLLPSVLKSETAPSVRTLAPPKGAEVAPTAFEPPQLQAVALVDSGPEHKRRTTPGDR